MDSERQKTSQTASSEAVSLSATLKSELSSLRDRPDQLYPLATLIVLLLVLIWSYWNTLAWAAGFWDDPLYSHGWLVPIFTVVLLWMRRQSFDTATSVSRWCGLALLGAALGLRLVATHYSLVVVDAFSFVPCVAGLFLLVGGWRLIRWAGPAIIFLVFMFPLPSVLKSNILGRLQDVATRCSTYVIQTLGIAAHREGNVIFIGDLQLGVVDACSGLRMATIFMALAIAIVLVVERPWWDRLIVLLSAIPIAIIVNIVRVTVTGMLYKAAGDSEFAQHIFHDWAGWFMMPLALGLLYVELQILSNLVIEDESSQLAAVDVRTSSGGPVRPPGI